MAVPELRDRSPRMMTLISTAVTGAFVYSLATVVFPTQSALVFNFLS
jgi:Cu2+-exporting ATPase